MRTTLDLPAALMDEAQKLLGFKSKTDTVVLSLTELVRRRRIEELRGLLGRVDLGIGGTSASFLPASGAFGR